MGYNSRDIQSIKELCHNVLIMLEENGGEDATALIRSCCKVKIKKMEHCRNKSSNITMLLAGKQVSRKEA
eukprot:1161817-Pelagomonas_calceolata.AAC.2